MDEARHTGAIAVLCLLTGLAAVHAIKVVIEPLPKGKETIDGFTNLYLF